mmetsp:Transcript_20220/g.20325  ORF Transcript_20220/g.20325 Transcript_20220/m.20325 type:complete len:675 (+) Transcript_20220:281-2305(+)|eukprot:CAMPEP_0182431942 /NCGR_PEP_ID=MMETSP1167-20130531/52815_1 /TAXON_ID=2988 /ORGANISM="Mallomonas Sp, Strain CCMP3275" /LENGTH=674 /DNA_ID=CAMNT_0024618869 /DNA_START=68 /DNA_END=2092 /DNA_ORIENTATION=-
MAARGLSVSFLIILVAIIFSWYASYDGVACIIEGAEKGYVNGFYAALGGMYIRRGKNIFFLPDFYSIYGLRNGNDMNRLVTVSVHERSWQIFTLPSKKLIYRNVPEHPEKYIFQPPESQWRSEYETEHGDASSSVSQLHISECRGSLADSPSLPRDDVSNIEMLLNRPVTTSIILLLVSIAYYLWTYRVPVTAVSFSYDAMLSGEVWRGVTASLSHFQLMHLGFNCMSMYQLGSLERVWGSVSFLYLNISLVFITIALCLALTHILILSGRPEVAHQHAVGYSCVLFAWMVAQSVRMRQYCPIFLLPSLCFSTFSIPLPLSLSGAVSTGVPVNLGPFLLLVFMKILIPSSSLIGHLSGILIGYPLAWNMIDWITPPIMMATGLAAYIWSHKLWVWRMTGYTLHPELKEFVVERQLRRYRALQWLQWGVYLLSLLLTLLYGPRTVPLRLCVCFLVWSAGQARRVEWMTEGRTLQELCATLLLLSALASFSVCVDDSLTLGASLGVWDLLIHSSAVAVDSLWLAVTLLSLSVLLHLSVSVTLVLCMHDMSPAEAWLTTLRLDARTMQEEVRGLGIEVVPSRSFGGGQSLMLTPSPSPSQSPSSSAVTPLDMTTDSATAPLLSPASTGLSLPSAPSRGPVSVATSAAAQAAMARMQTAPSLPSTSRAGKKPGQLSHK